MEDGTPETSAGLQVKPSSEQAGGATVKSPIVEKLQMIWRPKIIYLTDTNQSPLWAISTRVLGDVEEYVNNGYWEYLSYLYDAKFIIFLVQDGGSTGVISFDDTGRVINLPELKEQYFEDDIRELEKKLGGKALGYDVAEYLQKKYGIRGLASLVYLKARKEARRG